MCMCYNKLTYLLTYVTLSFYMLTMKIEPNL